MKWVVTVPEDAAGLFCTYQTMKATIRLFMNACDEALLILSKMQDRKLLTLRWHSFSECRSVCVTVHFDHEGGQYIENELPCTNLNIIQLPVAYLNATKNVKPEMRNWRMEPTGLAKPGKTCGLTDMGLGMARQESAGWAFGQVWNQTDLFLQSKSGLLAGYLDRLLTLAASGRFASVLV
jgi:hypothetical protein